MARPRAAFLLAALTALAALAGCTSDEGDGPGAAPSTSSTANSGGGTGGGPSDACAASPEMTVGPYFLDGKGHRSDIRGDYPDAAEAQDAAREEEGEGHAEDPDEEFIDAVADKVDLRLDQQGAMQAGVELRLTITVHELSGGACVPLDGARVDIWHANAYGKYSGYTQEGTAGEDWLRGAQTTDGAGNVTFTTIWPGWYSGRAVHIHVKVREGNLDFTSQFFFDPEVNAEVMADHAPYSSRPVPNTPNSSDGIYRQGGNNMILVTADEGGHYAGTKAIVVQ